MSRNNWCSSQVFSNELTAKFKELDYYNNEIPIIEADIRLLQNRLKRLKEAKRIAEYDLARQSEKEGKNG